MSLQKAKQGGAEPFKFLEAGTTLKGYYQGQVEKQINGSPAIEHTYKTDAGIVSVLGQANILSQLRYNGITPGTYVEVIFSGATQKLKGGRTMKVYDVFFNLKDRDPDFSPPTNTSEPESDESDVESEDAAMTPANHTYSSVPAPRPTAQPARTVVASAPSASRQAEIQAMLKSRRSVAS